MQGELEALPRGGELTLDLSKSKVVDCTVMENMHEFGKRYEEEGGIFHLTGLESHRPMADHPMAGRVLRSGSNQTARAHKLLSSRQKLLLETATRFKGTFRVSRELSTRNLMGFPSVEKFVVESESDVLDFTVRGRTFSFADLHCRQGFAESEEAKVISSVFVYLEDSVPPEFVLEPEGFLDDLIEVEGFSDIDFDQFPEFSRKWLLRGPQEQAIRDFFRPPVIHFLEGQDMSLPYSILSDGKVMMVHRQGETLDAEEVNHMIDFSIAFAGLNEKPGLEISRDISTQAATSVSKDY
jgi:hypothetical protein